MITPSFDDFDLPAPAPIKPALPVQVKDIAPGIYFGMSNEQYHSANGISCSGLKHVIACEADYMWSKQCPQDPEALRTFDIGTAFHCIIGEPDEFDSRYIIAPEFNRRTNQGKADEAAFLAEVAHENKIVLSHEDNKQLQMMRESCYAHPAIRWLLEAQGVAEASIFWRDTETGELMKIRPDKYIQINDHHIVLDYKSIGQFDQMENQVERMGYHVQDAMYSDGYRQQFGAVPDFYFAFCSTTLSCGRYQATCRQLPHDWKAAGHQLYRDALHKYHAAKRDNDWLKIPELTRPRWAR